VALCGSGIGISIAVNRHPALRCALVSEPLSAALAREHNNANVIAMGARLTGIDMAKACLTAFLNGQFGGAATPAASKSSPTPPSDPQRTRSMTDVRPPASSPARWPSVIPRSPAGSTRNCSASATRSS
jgi:hypothetical protein